MGMLLVFFCFGGGKMQSKGEEGFWDISSLEKENTLLQIKKMKGG